MLKIYLDWNCITHSKDKYPYILGIAEEWKNFIVFPFSNAHIRDVMVSHNNGNNYFQEDVKLLERICGNHFLSFENNQMMPKSATPNDVINKIGNELEFLQKFEFVTPQMYASIKVKFKELIPDIYKDIQGAEPKDVIAKIEKYISQNSKYKDIESLINAEAQKDTLEKRGVLSTLDKFVPLISAHKEQKKHLLSSDDLNFEKIRNTEARFKTVCFALDLLGFRPEKKTKHLMNIDTDASHIFYAGHCDILVTADSKLKGKAEAMYKKYNYQTRILHPKEFESFIEQELPKEYSFKYMSEVIDTYGVPRYENENAHYKLIPTQILGMFNVCHQIDKFWGYNGNVKAGLFRYCFNSTPYLFYTELQHFCEFIESLLAPNQKEEFRTSYTDQILSGNKDATLNARYTIDCPKLDMKIELMTDTESPVPLPMMLFIHGDSFDEKYDRFIARSTQ